MNTKVIRSDGLVTQVSTERHLEFLRGIRRRFMALTRAEVLAVKANRENVRLISVSMNGDEQLVFYLNGRY